MNRLAAALDTVITASAVAGYPRGRLPDPAHGPPLAVHTLFTLFTLPERYAVPRYTRALFCAATLLLVLLLVETACGQVPAAAFPSFTRRTAARARRPARRLRVPMTAQRWEVGPGARFGEQEGFPEGLVTITAPSDATILAVGRALLRGVAFADGTVEYDVKGVNEDAGGVLFRRKDPATAEWFYVRLSPDCPASNDCIQYAPQTHGLMQWDVYPDYQHAAPVNPAGWNHFRLVFAGRRLAVFVNRHAEPSLLVDRLAGAPGAGNVELLGPGVFANVEVRPGDISGLTAAEPARPAPDPHLVRRWRVAASGFAAGPVPTMLDHPGAGAEWRMLEADARGLVNLSRELGSPRSPRPATAWLAADVVSNRDQTKRVSLGWLREVTVFVNGTQVFSGENLYTPAGKRRAPDGRLSLENDTFDLPLRKGRNTVLVAVGNLWKDHASGYGWGVAMRFADLRDLRIVGPAIPPAGRTTRPPMHTDVGRPAG